MQTIQDKSSTQARPDSLANHYNAGGAANITPQTPKFEGYGDPNFIMLPRIFIRHQMAELSEAELKVMLYIFDHTWGYTDEDGTRKNADAISRSQFLNGIRKADGTVVDRGSGVSDRSLDRALNSLVERGYIFRHRQTDPSGRYATNIYELNRYGQTQYGRLADKESHQSVSTGESLRQTAKEPEHQVSKPAALDNSPANSHTVKFTPIAHKAPAFTTYPSNLRPTTPANLRPTLSVKLPDTKENSNQEKINQNTNTLTGKTLLPGKLADKPDEECVCVTVSNIQSVQSEKPEIRATRAGVMAVQPGKPPANQAKPGSIETPQPADTAGRGQLEKELLAAQVSKVEAQQLAGIILANGYGPGYVGQTLAYVDSQRHVKSRVGLLIHLIKTNWQLLSPLPEDGLGGNHPTYPEASGGSTLATQGQVVGVLPTLATVNPRHLPKLIEIEARNLREATTDRQRVTAQARLERLQAIASQLTVQVASETELNSPLPENPVSSSDQLANKENN